MKTRFTRLGCAGLLAALPLTAALAQTQTATGVGIGTTAPTQALDVSGGLLVRGYRAVSYQGAYLQWNRTNGDGATWLLNQGGNAGVGSIRFGAVTTGDAVTEWARFDARGNLGLGTSSPNAPLTVQATSGGAMLGFFTSSGVDKYNFSYINGGLNLSESNVAAGRLFVKDGGNVGIGTTSPNQPLEVAGQIFSNTGGFRFPDGTVQTTAAASATGANFIQNTTTQQAGASLNIDGSATVGGMVQAGTNIVVDATGANSGSSINILRFGGSNSGEGIGSKRTSGGNQYGLDFYAASANRMSISANGGIGIGTTTPNASAVLDVSSTTRGLLLPRLTNDQMYAITAPEPGLLVYNTVTNSFYGYKGPVVSESIDQPMHDYGYGNTSNIGQSFTAPSNTNLNSVTFYDMGPFTSPRNTPYTYTITIYAGAGFGGTALYSFNQSSTIYGTILFSLPRPLAVSANQVYTVGISTTSGTIGMGASTDRYSGGNAYNTFSQPNADLSFKLSFTSGSWQQL